MDHHLLFVYGPLLLGLGSIVGFFAGLLGLGGGIVLVPALLYGLNAFGYVSGETMHVAVGTSMAVIIPTGLSSAYAHWKQGGVRGDLLKKIGGGALCGVGIGMLVAGHISGHGLRVIFAVALLLIAVLINIDVRRINLAAGLPRQPWLSVSGAGIGLISTLMGIGGATIAVPFMILCKVPVKQAVGTAAALGVVISVPAVAGFLVIGHGAAGLPPFSFGYVNYLAWALIAPASILAAPIGAHVAHNMPVKALQRIFAALLVVVTAHMLYGVLHG